MKILKISAEATPGTTVDDALFEALALSFRHKCDIVVFHNDRRVAVVEWEKLRELIGSCK